MDEKEEKLDEIVSDEEVATKNKVNIVYFRPPFYQRIFANLVDILIFILLFVFLFLGIRAIVNSTPTYVNKRQELTQMRIDSGIYAYDDDGVLRDIVSVLNYNKGQTAKSRSVKASKAIDQFIEYCSNVSEPTEYQTIVQNYRDYRLSDEMKYNSVPMFVLDGDNVIENPELVDSAESVSSNVYTVYYEQAYAPYIDQKLQAFLLTSVPGYYDILKYETMMLLFVDILVSYVVSGLIVYLLPIFIFRRGRKTFGKALYGIGVVDKDCLSPKIGRTLARFSIFYFGELILSLFSFGLPFILSFTLMAFSKNRQGFPDYMLGLQEVDAKRTKIYFNFQEVELEKTSTYKKPVDFQTRNFD